MPPYDFLPSLKNGILCTTVLFFAAIGWGQSSSCALNVSLGENIALCKNQSITLTPVIENIPECTNCEGMVVEQTGYCKDDGKTQYVFWLMNKETDEEYFFQNVNLTYQEIGTDSVAVRGMVARDALKFELDMLFWGKKTSVKENKPHHCNDEDDADWVYLTEFKGRIVAQDGSLDSELVRMGPPFQYGKGANATENIKGRVGASSWFNTVDKKYHGDLNINLAPCDQTEELDTITFVWSTGDTSATLTVTPEQATTYSVTVTDCENCSATASVAVSFGASDITQTSSCADQSVTLTAMGGDSYLWSNGETTASIKIFPTTKDPYTVDISFGDCKVTQSIVPVLNCGESKTSLGHVSVFPTPTAADQELFVEFDSNTSQDIQYSIYSLSGSQKQEPIRSKVREGSNTIPLQVEQLDSGMYLLKISANGQVLETKCLMIQ